MKNRPCEKEVYDTVYSKEKQQYIGSHQPKVDYLVKWASDAQGTVLDLGCGMGRYLKALEEIGKEVFGVELSEVCCKTYLQDLPHENTDILSYALRGKKYNKVYSCDVLEHFPPEELTEVLKAITNLGDKFLFLVATGSDIHQGYDLHLSNHTFEEWEVILSKDYHITKSIKGFHTWPYIHIFEAEKLK